MKDDAQCWDDSTIQHIRLDDLSQLKCASGEGIQPGVTHVRNQVTLNEGNICVGQDAYLDETFMVQVTTGLYYKYIKLADIGFKKK